MRLFQDSDIHPHVMVLALARVTGEVGAGAALAGEHDPERVLGELAEVVRQAGREFREMLEAGAMPTAGSATGAGVAGARSSRKRRPKPISHGTAAAMGFERSGRFVSRDAAGEPSGAGNARTAISDGGRP